MLFIDTVNNLKCNFLLNAGFCSNNAALSSFFSQYNGLDSENFKKEFDEATEFLPVDLLLNVTLYTSTINPNTRELFYTLKMPRYITLLSRLDFIYDIVFFKEDLFHYLVFNIQDIFKISLIKSFLFFVGSFSLDLLKVYFKAFYSLLLSYTSIYSSKIIFSIFFFEYKKNIFFRVLPSHKFFFNIFN